jgi:hypothetical protein
MVAAGERNVKCVGTEVLITQESDIIQLLVKVIILDISHNVFFCVKCVEVH